MAHKQFETVKIERLNNVNYHIWKRRIKYLLTHEKTLHTVEKEKPKDADSKWEDDNALARATILNHMQDELIPLYEGFDTARKIMDMLEDKYGPKSETYIQLLLEQFNALKMSENDSMVDHILKLEIIAKDLSNAGHEISDKMQVSTLLNSLPESWDHVITSLTYGQKDLSMVTLPALLAVEEVRMKRRKKNNGNLLMAEDSNKVQGKNFKKRKAQNQGKKQKQHSKKKRGCFVCGDMGHFKANCPKRKKKDNQQKEVVLTVSEALIVESENQWWMDSGATRHVCKDKNSFFIFKDKALGEHRLYMGNNTYVDVLGEGDCKGIDIMRVDVELVPLVSFPPVNTAQYEPPNASFFFSNSRTPAHKTLSNEVVDISSDQEVNVNAHTEVGGANVYNEDDEEYNPYENGGLYSEKTEYGVHFKISTDLNFSDDNDDGAANNSSNDSDDDCLSDVVSFI
ncbi:hypothetical protein LWI29_010329 [Acer saccharum]|uniref:CCHC-type domain-containing protein n=1 Tax=Acer saccharum TaxID=4024 RepID=A0AA39RE28_ACESA|nr:hypothetical protein LWI29_010329 [Acer saccharum]